MNLREKFLNTAIDQLSAVDQTPEEQHHKYLEKGFKHYKGKVRDLYRNENELIVFHSDRLTAFDRAICNIPYKGSILAAFTSFWMNYLKDIVPTQKVEVMDPRTLKVDLCKPVKIEVVIRGYLAGSMLRSYKEGTRVFHEYTLPDNLKDYDKLPQIMITPTSKAEVFEHDEDISEQEILNQKICTESQWNLIKEYAIKIFDAGQRKYAEAGWILADTKYEFGLRDNEVVLIDECHSPDSSRLWKVDKNQKPVMFDKEIVRRHLLAQGFSGEGQPPAIPDDLIQTLCLAYCEVASGIMGKKFEQFFRLQKN